MKPHKPEESRFAKMLLHAPPGHGKTRFLGTAQEDPRTFPMAILDWDGGIGTLSGLDIDVFTIRDSKDYEDARKDLAHPQAPWNSYGVDSISETQINVMEEILGKDTIARADPDQLGQQDWGIVLTRMRRIVRQFFKTIQMHGFMTAHTMDKTVARVGSVRAPKLQGQFADEMPGIPDVVGYLALEDDEDGNIIRTLLLHGYPKFSVKARSPWGIEIPTEIVDPDVTKLLDALGFAKAGKKK